MSKDVKNQGEGDRESARRYNEAVKKTADNLSPDDFTKKQQLSEKEQQELRDAEQKGKARAKGEDPQVAHGTKTGGGGKAKTD
ncbi:MAG: hypothetical protein ACSLE5_08270 [Porticoccaceae bacterium]